MTKEIVVIGAGGFGREVLDLLEAWNLANPREAFNILGVVDDAPRPVNVDRLTARGYRILGPISALAAMSPAPAVVVAVNSPEIKRQIFSSCSEWGLSFPTLIHPSAVVGTQFVAGQGVVVCAGVLISTNINLGEHVHICSGAIIGHDTVIDPFCSINPGAVISGEVVIGARTLIGAGSFILQGITVGQKATVGAAACVTKEVFTSEVVVGVPARAMVEKKEKGNL